MKIYLLVSKQKDNHDSMRSLVVIASSHHWARILASENAHDEGPDVWLSPSTSTCQLVGDTRITFTGRYSRNQILVADVLEG